MSALRRSGNPPTPPDRFFGRAEELARLGALISSGDRLITVHGLAGMGKSRLVAEAARDRTAVWADLSTATTVEALASVLADALGIRLEGPDPLDRIGRSLTARGAVLVVLDDLDPALAADLAPLVAASPDACWLATARAPLKLRGERTLALGPLANDDGVALLLDRSARPDAAPAEVAALVDELDGMPLAIEIAAARTRVLPIPDLRRRLDDRLRLLVSDQADLPERHRSLAAAIEASATWLSPAARAAARQLTVFQGGFLLDAAEAVLDPVDGRWAGDLVQELVDASLVRLDPSGRLAMPSAVRAWAGPAERATEERHGAWYAGLGSPGSLAALDVHGGVERWRATAAELANLEAAFARAVDRSDGPIAAGTALAIGAVLRRRGPAGAALRRLEAAATLPPVSHRFRLVLAVVLRESGRTDEAAALLGELLDDPALAGEVLEAEARLQLAATRLQSGRWEEAEDGYRRALARFRAAGEERLVGVSLAGLGLLHAEFGDPERARAEYREALGVVRRVGDRQAEGMVLANLGLLDRREGRLAEAHASFEAALAVQRELGHRRAEGRTLGMIAAIAGDRGDAALGRPAVSEALRAHREVGDRWFEGVSTAILGQLDQLDGDLASARAHLEDAAAIDRATGNHRSAGASLGNLGSLLAALGEPDAARRAWEEALEVARGHGDLGQQGVWLTRLARDEVRTAPRRARARLEEAERALRAGGSRLELALSLCVRAELDGAAGDVGSAEVALQEAAELAARAEVGPRSELATELARVRAASGLARVLEVAADGSGFRLGDRVGAIASRHAIRRVLLALVGAHRSAPLDVDQLFAAGWPGEQAVREAARERVYHAIGTLRRAGLAEVLERVEGGWRLDPTVDVQAR